MLPAFHREQLAASTDDHGRGDRAARWPTGGPAIAARPVRVDAPRWRCASRCARCSASTPTPARATSTRPRRSSARSAYWGKDYVVQMMRGPGSAWRAMNQRPAELDRVLFAEIARRRAAGERGRGHPVAAARRDRRGRLAAVRRGAARPGHDAAVRRPRHDDVDGHVPVLRARAQPDERATRGERPVGGARRGELRRAAELEWRSTRRCGCTRPPGSGRGASIEPFELAGVPVPGGVFVNYCSWASHHLPDVFAEPEALPARALRARGAGGAAQGRLRPVRRRLAHLHRDALRAARGEGDRADDPAALPAGAGRAGPRAVDPPDADALAPRRAAGGRARTRLMGGAWLEQATSTV